MEFIEKQDVYKGRRITVEEAKYNLDNNNIVIMEHVKVKSAVAILAETDDGKFIFIKQKRTPIGNKDVLEIPAGVIEDGEGEIQAAFREFKEETGYDSFSMEYMTSYYTSCGYSNEVLYLFYTNDIGAKDVQNLDADEKIDVILVDKNEALKMLSKKDTLTGAILMALLYYKAFKTN